MSDRNLTAVAAEHASRAFVEDFERRALAPPMSRELPLGLAYPVGCSREELLDTVITACLDRWQLDPDMLHSMLFGRYGTIYKNLIVGLFLQAEGQT